MVVIPATGRGRTMGARMTLFNIVPGGASV
jgi:hypothetical protein